MTGGRYGGPEHRRLGRLLSAQRAVVGAALLLAPGPLWRATVGGRPSGRELDVTRVLGLRLLVQGAVTAALPRLLGGGAAVDALHATTLLALAAARPAYRRPALASATDAASAAFLGRRAVGQAGQ